MAKLDKHIKLIASSSAESASCGNAPPTRTSSLITSAVEDAPSINAPQFVELFINELNLYKYLSECKTVKGFLHRIECLVQRAGFSGYTYAYLNSNRNAGESVGSVISAFQRIYNSEEFYKYDLAVQHTLVSDAPVLVSQVSNLVNKAEFFNPLFARHAELYKVMQSFGYNDYWNCAFQSHSGNGRALVAFGTEGLSVQDFRRTIARNNTYLPVLARAIDAIGTQKFPTHFSQANSASTVIHSRPLELLRTIAKHRCTLTEAAGMLNITVSTANQHIAAAKQALGATNTTAAVLAALQLGLIKLDE